MMTQFFRNIQDEIIKLIKQSTFSIKISVTWFTNQDLFEALMQKLDNPEFKIELIVLNDIINNKKEGVDFQKIIDKNGSFYFSDTESLVHHKFCIIDDKIVVTGSYNWTYYAENRNWENIVILNDPNIVEGFIEEFEKIKQNHKKVIKVVRRQKLELGINSNKYLQIDYLHQVKKEEEKGNDLVAAKIYTEILKLDSKQEEVKAARTELLKKINGQSLITCPFEIGIQYNNGYSMAIPAFSPLPITVVKESTSSVDYAVSCLMTIQKYDYIYKTILTFSIDNIYSTVKEKQKFEETLTIDKNGILTVISKEVNGYGRKTINHVDLKKWL
jgi:PLD-like domain